MSHYTPEGTTPNKWRLEEPRFGEHDLLPNVAKKHHNKCRVEVKLDLGLPWLFTHPYSPGYIRHRSSILDRPQFLVDTGASMSVLIGKLADDFYPRSEKSVGETFLVANGAEISAPTGFLCVGICGSWCKLRFGFWRTCDLQAAASQPQPDSRKSVDSRATNPAPSIETLLETPNVLGMEGLLPKHLLSITHEQVDVFRRQDPAQGGQAGTPHPHLIITRR